MGYPRTYDEGIHEFTQDLIDPSRERGGSFSKTEGHHQPFEVTVSRVERRFLLILLPNPQLVISRHQVQGRKPSSTVEPLTKFFYAWDWSNVPERMHVQVPVIYAHSQLICVWFFDEQYRRAPGRFGMTDVTRGEKFHQLSFHFG